MKITFLVLAHNDPDAVIEIAKFVTSYGHSIIVHYDASADKDNLSRIEKSFENIEGNAKVISEISCAWGRWSLVEAPLKCLEKIEELGWQPDYVHLMSAADHFTKSISLLEKFFSKNSNLDFIESVDITNTSWVQGGLEIERFKYYYPFSFIDQKRPFDLSTAFQRALSINRKIPDNLEPRMGSQWWTLRGSTCQKITKYIKGNPKLTSYFKTTWIPDESFFQTIVAHLVPQEEIAQVQLLFHWLSPNGRPFIFKNGHEKLAASIPHFLIRKVSSEATELHKALETCRTSSLDKEPPSLNELKLSTTAIRASLNLEASFEADAIWSSNYQSWEYFPNFFIFIFHREEETQELIKICDQLSDIVEYVKQPFPQEAELRPQKFKIDHRSPKSSQNQILALLTPQTDRLHIASVILGKDKIPEHFIDPCSDKISSILLPSKSKLITQIDKNKIFTEHQISAVSIQIDDLANELRLLKTEQDQLQQSTHQ